MMMILEIIDGDNESVYNFVAMTNSSSQNYFGLKELPGVILKNVLPAKRTSCTFTMKQEDFSLCKKKPALLWYTLARGGIHKADVSYSSEGVFSIKNIIWWEWPMYSVKTEDELAAAVQKSKQKNSPAFGLLLEKTFFDTCQKNPSIKEAALLKGGLFSFGAAYYDDDLCAYWYKQCRYKSFCIVPGALEYSSAMRVLSAGLNGAEAVALMLDDSSWKLTLRNAQYIGEWAACAGLKGVYVQKKELRAYIFGTEQDAFQPAVRILASLRNGTQDKLPAKYKKALAAARIITKNVSGKPLEMYAQIHDSLCRRITYEINPKNEDNSSCVGALVNGRAKCDGYADAFYLCCGLKGLPAAYLAGKSKVHRKNTDGDNHMWNLLFLGGTWRCVDVTWDDGGEDILYDYFNIGLDRMKDAYSFTPAMIPSNMAVKTDTAERMTQEYPAESESDITDAIREMIISGKDKLTIRCSEKLMKALLRDGDIFWRSMTRAGGRQCDCSYRDNTILIRNLAVFPHWAYCDSEEAVISAAENIRNKRITEFTFVFEPKLFTQVFNGKNRFSELYYLFAVCGLEFGASRFNESYCAVTFLEIKPCDSFAAEASSLSEIEEAVRDGLRKNKSSFDLWLTPNLFKKIMRDPQQLFSVLPDKGINKKISWSYSEELSRIQIRIN